MKISFIFSLVVIVISIMYLLFRRKNNLKTNIVVGFITCIISISILVFPLLEYTNDFIRGLASFIYAIKSIVMEQDLSVLARINLSSMMEYFYLILLVNLFLLTPALTVSFIVSYLERIISNLKFIMSKNKKLYVFSELNDKSIILSKNLENKKKIAIIFCNVQDKKDIGIKSIKLSDRVENINFNSNSDITFYMVDANEEENLNATLALIDKYKTFNKIKINVVNQSEETPVILDSMDKGNITVEIINENERAVFNLLNNTPLFLNTVDKTISILIVGCGNVGKEFLRDSVWCGMMPNYKLRFLVIDIKADIIKDNISVEMPELLSNYDITFVNADIKSNKAIEMINDRGDVNYILVSTDSDAKNIDIAIMLRRLYLRNFNREPIINLYIENDIKNKEIIRLSNEKNNGYNLNAFGSMHELYQNNIIIDSELEKLAKKVHLAYDPDDKDLKRYNLREYNKRSSRASAVHIKYRLKAVLGDNYTLDMKENQRLFKEKYNDRIEEILSRNEHDRWSAYTRSVGYVYVSCKEVAKYYKSNKNYVDYLARRHPALVEYDELDNVSKELSKITSKEVDLKESDTVIIRLLKDKIEL